MLTVEQLIAKLQQIPDKTLPVVCMVPPELMGDHESAPLYVEPVIVRTSLQEIWEGTFVFPTDEALVANEANIKEVIYIST